MKYWSRSFLLFLSLVISGSVYCQSNPLNAVFNLKSPDSIDDKNVLVIGVASEKNESKYKLMVDNNGDAIKLTNGNEVFTGKAGSTVREEHFLPFDIKKEGEGEISVRIYIFTDSMDIDSTSKREFAAKYTVKKKATGGYDVNISEVIEKHGSDQSNQASAPASTPAQPGALTITDMKEVVSSSPDTQQNLADPENQQKFVINTQKRYNGLLRSLLFVFSFFILGYLCYRILNKK